MTTDYALFDASSYLDSDEMIAEYLTACAEDENPDVLLAALADVAKARGMTNVARAAGLSRESLYKTLAPGAHPRFQTIRAILRALNVRVVVKPPTAPLTRIKVKRKTSKPATAAEKAAKEAATKERYRKTKKAAAKPATPAKKRA